jgi:hypothetical protein
MFRRMRRLSERGGLARVCPVSRKQPIAPTCRQVSNCGHPADLPKRTLARTNQDPAAKMTFRICDSLLLLWKFRDAGCDGASYYSVTRSVFPATWRSPADCSSWRIGGSVVGSGTRHIPGEHPVLFLFSKRANMLHQGLDLVRAERTLKGRHAGLAFGNNLSEFRVGQSLDCL